jgi:hypothetical protein
MPTDTAAVTGLCGPGRGTAQSLSWAAWTPGELFRGGAAVVAATANALYCEGRQRESRCRRKRAGFRTIGRTPCSPSGPRSLVPVLYCKSGIRSTVEPSQRSRSWRIGSLDRGSRRSKHSSGTCQHFRKLR